MSRALIRVFLLLTGGGAAVLAADRLPEAAVEWELFHVRTVVVEGARLLPDSEVVSALALAPRTPVWSARGPWEERIVRHPVIREARVRRRPPATLLVTVREEEPVAFLPTPALTPVDGSGRLLPLDPVALALDLPIIQPLRSGNGTGVRADRRSSTPDGRPWDLTPEEVAAVAREMERLLREEPGFTALISHVRADGKGGLVASLTSPGVDVHFQAPLASSRLRDGLRVLEDALERYPQRAPREVDLRYADQVVVRLPQRNGS